jgi:hypothetical protein
MSFTANSIAILFAAQISMILGLLLLRAKKVRVEGLRKH